MSKVLFCYKFKDQYPDDKSHSKYRRMITSARGMMRVSGDNGPEKINAQLEGTTQWSSINPPVGVLT
jgi:hypothetical protein